MEKAEYLKKWKAEHPEAHAAHVRLYAETHVDELRAKKAVYRASQHGKTIRAADQRKRYLAMGPELRKQRILASAKYNAKNKGVEFSISINDVEWPERCPVFGTKLNYGCPTNGKASWDSPSIDRHDHTKGYVRGNVFIMSWRANALKRDATNEEVRLLLEYLNKTRSN